MSRLQDLTIRAKVAAAFGLVLAITLALGLFAVEHLGIVHDRAADVRDRWFPATRALEDYAFQTMRVRQMEAVVLLAPPEVAAVEEQLLRKITADAMKAWLRYEPTIASDEARAVAQRIREGWEGYLLLDSRLRALLAAGGGGDEAYAFYAGEMRRAYAEWRDILVQGVDLQMREGDRAFRHGEEAYLSARVWIYGAVALAVGLSGLAGFFIVTSVSRPIRRLTGLMQRLAGNELSVAVGGAERRDEIGAMARAVAVFKDNMVERERLSAELERHARLDPLTGALNRRAFHELIQRDVARAQRHARPLSVALLDIDHFKRLNDTMGHQMGDKFLVAVAEAIPAQLRTEDLFCRYGGEEFVIALTETDAAGALRAADRVRLAVAEIRIDHDSAPRSVTVSVGVATFGTHGDTIEAVIKAADVALYRAKGDGRNRVVGYDPTLSPTPA